MFTRIILCSVLTKKAPILQNLILQSFEMFFQDRRTRLKRTEFLTDIAKATLTRFLDLESSSASFRITGVHFTNESLFFKWFDLKLPISSFSCGKVAINHKNFCPLLNAEKTFQVFCYRHIFVTACVNCHFHYLRDVFLHLPISQRRKLRWCSIWG
jgi:hypothetical protein